MDDVPSKKNKEYNEVSESQNVYLKKFDHNDDLQNYIEMVNDESNVYSIESLRRNYLTKEDLK